MNEFTINDFEEEMKMDAAEYQAEMKLEFNLRSDYEFFMNYHEDQFKDLDECIKAIKNLYKQYDHDFDIRELDDRI